MAKPPDSTPPEATPDEQEESYKRSLILIQAQYLVDGKKIYIQQIDRTEQISLISVGATMLFLSTEALSSVDQSVYIALWLVPAVLSMYAYLKINALYRSLADISAFEAKHVEPLFKDKMTGWEGYLAAGAGAKPGNRGAYVSSLLKSFWLCASLLGFAFVIYQLIFGSVFIKG